MILDRAPSPGNPRRPLDGRSRAWGDIITADQLRAVGWSEDDLRQLPTPHGRADDRHWPLEDVSPWLDMEDDRP
jgi:hypothetical protein